MKPIFSLITLLAVLAPAAAQVPKIRLSETEWEFGRRDQGEKERKSITVTNIGDGELVISKIGVTCGCVSGKVESERVAPNASTTLHIDLDTARQTGVIRKHVYIESNAHPPKYLIPINGEILPTWWISTRTVNFGAVDEGREPTQSFRIEVRPGKKLDLGRIRQNNPRFTVTTKPFGGVDEDHGWMVTVKLHADNPIGRFAASVTVEVDDIHKPADGVSLVADILGPILVQPRNVRFGSIKQGESKTVVMRVTGRTADKLVIDRVACSDKQITATVVEKVPGKVFEIEVTCTPDGTGRRVAGRFYVSTNVARQKLIPVYYQAGVRP